MEKEKSKKYEKGYKGFNRNMVCINKKYEIGRTEKENKAILCNMGMHYCPDPLDVFNYYGFDEDAEYATVKVLKVPQRKSSMTYYGKDKNDKKVTTELTPVMKYDIDELIYEIGPETRKKQSGGKKIDNILKVSKEENSYNYNNINDFKTPEIIISEKENSISHICEKLGVTYGQPLCITTSNNSISSLFEINSSSVAISLGQNSIVAAKNTSHATILANGYKNKAYIGENAKNTKAIATERFSSLECHSYLRNNVMIGMDKYIMAKGKIGNWIVLAEYDDVNDEIIDIKSVKIDGEKIKEDTYYELKNGEFVEVNK